MFSDDEDNQPNVRAKENHIEITLKGHAPSVKHSKISDDEDTDDTPEEPRGMGL